MSVRTFRAHRCSPDHKHGATQTCYTAHGCGCDACRVASNERRVTRRRLQAYGQWRGMIPAIGTQRRIQALVHAGWSLAGMSARLGYSPSLVHALLNRKTITPKMYDAISALYDDLWDAPPPRTTQRDREVISRARALARRHGWVSALAWDDIDDVNETPATTAEPDDEPTIDDIAVELSARGQKVRIRPHERHAVIPRLYALKWGDYRIGNHIGCRAKIVARIRHELGLPDLEPAELADAA